MPKTTNTPKRNLESVIKNLNKEISKIEGRTLKGLLHAGMFISAEATKGAPIKYGNLRGSRYVLWSGGGENTSGTFRSGTKADKKTKAISLKSSVAEMAKRHADIIARRKSAIGKDRAVEAGFTASYAIAVHEINKNYHKGTWKFLQFAIRNNKDKILAIIKKFAKGKGNA